MIKRKAGYIIWRPQEWDLVTVAALPELANAKTKPQRLKAYTKAQRLALPKHRHYTPAQLERATVPSQPAMSASRARVHAMSEKERSSLRQLFHGASASAAAPVDAPEQSNAEGDAAKRGRIVWTPLEAALIARRVHYWQVDQQSAHALATLVIKAQHIELPPERHKARSGLYTAERRGTLAPLLAEGFKDSQGMLKGVPFDFRAVAPSPAAIAAFAMSAAPAALLQPPSAPAVPFAAPPAAAAPETPAGQAETPISETAAEFGRTVARAFEVVLVTHRAAVLREMETQMHARLEQVIESAAMRTAALIQQGMRAAVHQMIAQELGGGLATQAPANDEAAPINGQAVHLEPARRPRIKVDIVGGFQAQDITSRIERNYAQDFDLRFVHPDNARYVPSRDRECIYLFDRSPHDLLKNIKSAKVAPIMVKATEAHISHALDELRRAKMT